MEFITTGNRIAVENFDIGKIYTITWQTGNNKSLACTGKGTDFVMFQDQEPDLLFCLTMDSAITVSSIEEGGGGSGTMNYNELENKPSINGFVLVGNKTGAELGLASQSDLEDYATNASVVAGLATKQDALSSSQLAAVNSGITSALVTQIGTNTSAIAGKQDALSSSQLAAVNSGITSALVTQIGTNTSAIAGKQDALSSSQLAAVNSGITSALVTQIGTNTSAIAGKQDALSSSQLAAVNSGITSADVAQITTNKNNISYNSNTGVKNVLKNDITTVTLGGVTGTTNSDGSITLSSSGAVSNTFVLDVLSTQPVSNYNGISKNTTYTLKGTGSDKVGVQVGDLDTEEGTFYLIATASTSDETYTISRNYVRYRIIIYSGAEFTTPYTIYPLSTLSTHDTNYVPYAPSNAELYAMIKALQA